MEGKWNEIRIPFHIQGNAGERGGVVECMRVLSSVIELTFSPSVGVAARQWAQQSRSGRGNRR